MTDKIRVVIADDTDIAREGFRRILSFEEDIDVVGEAATASDAVQTVQQMQPDILFLDLKWFDDENAGMSVIEQLREKVPRTKIVAFTVYSQLAGRAKAAGASCVLSKDVSKQRLIEEIRSVYAQPMLGTIRSRSMATLPVEQLTSRETEVLALMAEGKTDKEIAEVLNIAESTAKNHVSLILGKLNVSNRAGAVALAYELRLLGAE